jgi:glycosyltransferase domain-containing protein
MNYEMTLVLITHNRPIFLKRSLDYYSGVPYRLMVLDSSVHSLQDEVSRYAQVDYIHCPEFGYKELLDKVKKGVSLVCTPYMAFVADDDFILHSALDECLRFLQYNTDYGLCHGYCLMYLAEAEKVHYFRREKIVKEDYCSESAGDRILDFMANYMPPYYAVTRTDLMKEWHGMISSEYGMEFQEFGHSFHLLANSKARVLRQPYVVREQNYPVSDHGTDIFSALHWKSGSQGAEKRRFMAFLADNLMRSGCPDVHAKRLVEEAFRQLSECLISGRSLHLKEIFHSQWDAFAENPSWIFEPEQFVEMPYYNQVFFAELEVLDLLIRVCPAGKLQLEQLGPVIAEQQRILLEYQDAPCVYEVDSKLLIEQAFKLNPFNCDVATLLGEVNASMDGPYARWAKKLAGATAVSEAFQRIKVATDPDAFERFSPARSNEVSTWLAARQSTPSQMAQIADFFESHGGGPQFVVFILDLEGDEARLNITIDSFAEARRFYPALSAVVLSVGDFSIQMSSNYLNFIQVSVAGYIAKLNCLVEESSSYWVILARAGEQFTTCGLQIAAQELALAPDCWALYGDELQRMPDGSLGAALRPGFNLDLMLSFPAVMARHWLIRRDLLIELGGFNVDLSDALELDFLLRLIEVKGLSGLGHVSEPLVISDALVLVNNAHEQSAILRHLASRGYHARLVDYLPGRYRIAYGHENSPLVSIIIPTKDQLPILQRCVESLLEKTRYQNYELLIVDNASEAAEACEWLAAVERMGEEKVRVLRYPQPFNYSAINNMAAREARGEYLVLLNNDTAIISESWLDELLNHAQRPEVGIVGAKLLLADGFIQHAGIVLGLRGANRVCGPAQHPFVGEGMDSPGFMNRLQVDQNYSAVTAACLMIRKSIYEEVGGLDEENFKVSYNDVDLCLKVGDLGYLTVWTPHAVVMHEGSVSQKQVDPASLEAKHKRFVSEQNAMYAKWLPKLANDPAYNVNLALNGPGFTLETNIDLTWRPLAWRPLPVMLAHNADPWGCGHYRIIKPHGAMCDAGLIDGAVADRLLEPAELLRLAPDVVVYQRPTKQESLDNMERSRKFSTAFKVYELDDYLPNVPIKSAHRTMMSKDLLKLLRKGLGYVDRFVVSTPALANALGDFHADIRIVENRLPLDWWGQLALSINTAAKPRVGWAGGAGHQGDLELIADVVRDLADEVDWVFFGMCPDKLRPYVAEYFPGIDIQQYPGKMASLRLDLALAPLEDNLFNACKSNLKLLEYGVCGYPVIASDIECYRGGLPVTLVKNRYRDWMEAIRAHLADRQALAARGSQLRETIQRDWMLTGSCLEAWRNAWLPD